MGHPTGAVAYSYGELRNLSANWVVSNAYCSAGNAGQAQDKGKSTPRKPTVINRASLKPVPAAHGWLQTILNTFDKPWMITFVLYSQSSNLQIYFST